MFSWCSRSLLVLALAVPAVSQEYDTTYKTRLVKYFQMPITYFDFHSDGSNYEFGAMAEQRFKASGLPMDSNLKGWADSSLTAEKKPRRAPTITDPSNSLSYNIEKLFSPWVAGTLDSFIVKGDSIFPLIDSVRKNYVIGTDTTWYYENIFDTIKIALPDTKIIHDSLYKNVMVPDTLKFDWAPNPLTIDDTTDSIWEGGSLIGTSDLEGKGFADFSGKTWSMSLHNKFTYKGGEVLYIGADDDYYIYINGKLVNEGGGFHAIIVDSVYLDSLGLTKGQKYDFDAFYVNRRAGGGIFITGITDFETKWDGVDTIIDTIITEKIVPVAYTSKKASLSTGFLGFSVPMAAYKVRVDIFSLTGRKLLSREFTVGEARNVRFLGLPKGLSIAKAAFYDSKGEFLSKQSRRLLQGTF